ncbi:hypothetical protein FSARC_13490 [Fusarium sarcochroum]|uniref:RNA-dependent RNA polymerase n=1 Tax=Fusarium sarcochroum TaxID=1208366 RepID=A0A8H4WTH6_9HYPO|nr:hypothetical protein FSARC_13490 [Fusarium sarcochroum]
MSATRVTNAGHCTSRIVPRSQPSSHGRANGISTTWHKAVARKDSVCDDLYFGNPSRYDDDSDGSDYSVSSALADEMGQMWNVQENSQSFTGAGKKSSTSSLHEPPSRASSATVDQTSRMQEHNTSQEPALAYKINFTWPSCPMQMENAPLIIKWETHRIAQHCSISLKSVVLRYSSAWEDQRLFRRALKSMSCFHEKTFPPECDSKVWLEGLSGNSECKRDVVFKAILHLNHKTGDAKLEFGIPTLERSSRLRRKFGFDRFIDLQLLISSRSRSSSQADRDRALAKWLVHNDHLFLSRKWTAFFIEDPKFKPTSATLSSEFREVKKVCLFAEEGQGLEPHLTKHSTIAPIQQPARTVCDRFSMLDWLLRFDHNMSEPYMKLFHRISQGLTKATPTIVLSEDQLQNHPGDIKSATGKTMNDGIGRVSIALMKEVQHALGLDHLPAAIQGRIGSAKGVWILDTGNPSCQKYLETYTSQRKWDCDWADPEQRTLEVVSQSSGLEPASLNIQFIPILEDRANNRDQMRTAIIKHTKRHLQTSLERAKEAMTKPELFRKWIHETSYSGYSDNSESWFVGGLPKKWTEALSFLSDGGFEPLKLKFMHGLTFDHVKSQWEKVNSKMKIKIDQSTWALMTVDFQKVLAPDEVHLCFSSAFNDGLEDRYDLDGLDVLVARCPAHLPSDIQKVKAVFKPELRHLKDVIIFPSTGDEPLADRLSGGDYDGDRAWICWDSDITDNFRNAKVPPKPSFDGYLQANKCTVESLSLTYGKAYFLDHLLEEAFTFHIAPKLVGICTDYKERLSYQQNSICTLSVTNLSWLLNYCGGNAFLERPSYKLDTTGNISESCHILDYLKSTMQELIDNGLSDLSSCRLEQDGECGIWELSTFDADLAAYWDDFETGVEDMIQKQDPASTWLRELRSNLERDIKACFSYWGKMMSGTNHYFIKLIPVYERWVSISPKVITGSKVATAVIWSLTQPFTNTSLLGGWQLLKASLTFKLYHDFRPKFAWQMAGRQLQYIKALRVREARQGSSGGPIPVTPRTYKLLRPDGKKIGKLHSDCGEVSSEDMSYSD